jgi:hypothetical protein
MLMVIMKLFHAVIFYFCSDRPALLTFVALSETGDCPPNSTDKSSASCVRYHLWLCLSLNAFTCGVMLGTIVYHLIPHVRLADDLESSI